MDVPRTWEVNAEFYVFVTSQDLAFRDSTAESAERDRACKRDPRHPPEIEYESDDLE